MENMKLKRTYFIKSSTSPTPNQESNYDISISILRENAIFYFNFYEPQPAAALMK